jgi:hypothetical protein
MDFTYCSAKNIRDSELSGFGHRSLKVVHAGEVVFIVVQSCHATGYTRGTANINLQGAWCSIPIPRMNFEPRKGEIYTCRTGRYQDASLRTPLLES